MYDYTDGNRTTITQGSHQSVTVGHRTDVILGDYRLIIPKRTNGVFDADVYGMRYRKQSGHWRKTEWSHVASDTYAWGDTESFFWGSQFELAGGVAMSGFLGGKLDATVAIAANLNLGASIEASAGDKFVYTVGDERKRSSSHLINADKTITLAIGSQTWHRSWLDVGLAAGAGVLGAASMVGAAVSFDDDNPNTSIISSAVLGGLAILAGGALATRLLIDDAKSPEGYPRIIMDKDDGLTIEASADNSLLFNETGLLIKIGGADGSVIDITSQGILLKAGGKGALLLDSAGGAAVTVDGSGLTSESAVGDAPLPAVSVDSSIALLGFSDSVGVGANAGGVAVVE